MAGLRLSDGDLLIVATPESAEDAINSLPIIDFTESQAVLAGQLIEKTSNKGLSFEDRACLSLAMQKKCVAFTADKAWARLKLGIQIDLIR